VKYERYSGLMSRLRFFYERRLAYLEPCRGTKVSRARRKVPRKSLWKSQRNAASCRVLTFWLAKRLILSNI